MAGIVGGFSESNDGDITGNHGSYDYWVVKLDSSGTLQWQKSLGGSTNEDAYSIQQTIDGGYVIAGYSYSNDGDVSGHHLAGAFTLPNKDYWIVKLDSSGTIQWQKSLGGYNDDVAQSIQQTTDSGYIIAGLSYSNEGDVSGHHGSIDSTDYWVVKLDTAGIIQWQKSLGGNRDDYAQSIQQTADGGYIIAGSSLSTDGNVSGHHGTTAYYDYWLIKLDNLGTILWQKSLGGSSNDFVKAIQQTSDGGYVVAGGSVSINGDVSGHHGINYPDYWIVKLFPDSVTSSLVYPSVCDSLTLNSQTYYTSGTYTQTLINHFGCDSILTIHLVVASSINTTITQSGVTFTANQTGVQYQWLDCNASNAAMAGDTNQVFTATINGSYAVTLSVVGCQTDTSVCYSLMTVGLKEMENNQLEIYPNPATNSLTIAFGKTIKKAVVTITDITGKIIYTTTASETEKMEVSTSGFADGIYIVKIQTGDGVETKKLNCGKVIR